MKEEIDNFWLTPWTEEQRLEYNHKKFIEKNKIEADKRAKDFEKDFFDVEDEKEFRIIDDTLPPEDGFQKGWDGK